MLPLIKKLFVITTSLAAMLLMPVTAQSAPESTKPKIHIIYFGGNDCPPCVTWRATEFLKLQKSEIFKSITFTYVTKAINSAVPSGFFLPSEVKPFKEKLDIATGRNAGSPQVVMLVNDEVHDTFFGSRSAEQYEKMILSVQQNTPYPEPRCVRQQAHFFCAEKRAGNW